LAGFIKQKDGGSSMSYNKVLTCTSAGTIAIPSKMSHGCWEFDLYKGSAGNEVIVRPISANAEGSGVGRYTLNDYTDNRIRFYRDTIGNMLLETASSYTSNNTWYRIKVARLLSSGVFKDIQTLQVSDLVNSGMYPYDSFTSYGRYGMDASTGTGTCLCGVDDEISLINTEKYLVEFDAVLTSGTVRMFFQTDFGGSSRSDSYYMVNGRNSYIFTASGTDTCVLSFYNNEAATSFTVRGLTIRRIYDPHTFAVFIKGGSFGSEWTLVDTTGGSGSNPVTDSTYTTSNFMVCDLDSGDKISQIRLTDGSLQ
jgi:hypothetical protein